MRRFPGLAPLRHRDFALYWVGQAVSMSGTWMEVTATSWLLYDLTSSPLLLGLGGVFRAVPVLLFSLVGGAVADRVPRRNLLLVTQSAQVLTSLVLGTLVVTHAVAVWHIYAVSLANGTIGAFDAPARSSFFPSLVPRHQLQNAVTLTSILFRLSTLVGPALAGTLIATAGLPAPYFVNAASFFAIIGALLLIRARDLPTRSDTSLRADAVGGIRYVLATPVLPLVLSVEVALSLFGHNSALITVFARDVLGVGAQGLGLLLGGVGAGALAGMVALVAIGDVRRKGALMLASGIAYATALALFAWSRSFALSLAVLMLLGVADAVWGAMRNTVAQLSADDAHRGRVMSLFILTTRGLTQLSQLQAGALITLLGPPLAATIGAGLVASAIVAVGTRGARLRGFESTRRVEATPGEVAATPSD